jgi:hypothetical protein
MFLKLTASGALQLEDRENFRAFKLVVDGERSQLEAIRSALAGKAELPDAETAWISEAMLRQWPSVARDEAWQQSLSAMIDKARPHGWIDDQRKAIKAHIEWTAAS